MPRPLRIEFENAWYHVMNRGMGKRAIFKTDHHRQLFLNIMAQTTEIFGAEVHAYCLMDNHYHLLIKTPRGNLARIMRHINGVYTQQFNYQENKSGSLFKGRYKAILVHGDDYLLQVSRYIHLNPVTTQLVKKANHYRWSSYTDYLQPHNKRAWISVQPILSMMNSKQPVALYQRFIEKGLDHETTHFYNQTYLPTVFSQKETKKTLLKKSDQKKRTHSLPSLNKISRICANHLQVKEKNLYQAKRGITNLPRKIAIYGSRVWASEKIANIAEHYGCQNHSSISSIVKSVEEQRKKDKKFARLLQDIRESI